MNSYRALPAIIICSIVIASSGCAGYSFTPGPSPTPTQTDTNSPTATAAASPTPTPTPSPLPIPPPMGQIELPYRENSSPAIDDRYVYWQPSDDRIVRQPLISTRGVQPETIATTRYPSGRLNLLPMQRSGDWLFFVDSVSTLQGPPQDWMLRAFNVNTGAEKVIAQNQGTSLLYNYSAEDGRVAMTLSDWGPNKKCPGADKADAVLAIIQLDTGKPEELDRECFDQVEWLNVALSGDNLFATRAIPNQTTSDVVLFNLKDGSIRQPSQLLDAPATGLLAAQGSWVAWDAMGGTLLYNLSTGEHQLISPTDESGPLQYPVINGRWLYWIQWGDGTKVVVYDLEQKEMDILAIPGENELVWNPFIHANMIVWVRALQIDQAGGASVIEWTKLPGPD